MVDVFRARWIVPVDSAPIPQGELAVAGGRIVGLGPRGSQPKGVIHDLGDATIIPGLINAHAHLELGCYAGVLPPSALWDWLARLVQLRRAPGAAEREAQAVAEGAAASLAAGVTCIADISREAIHAAPLARSPIRKICFAELISGAARPPNDADSLERTLDALSEWVEPGRLDLGISPHTPYTVDPDHLAAAIGLAARRHLPWTLHLLETPEEAEWLLGSPDATPGLWERVRDLGITRDRLAARRSTLEQIASPSFIDTSHGASRQSPLFAHVNYGDDWIVDRLRASNASVVWCPRAHAFFGHRPHPWRCLVQAGINVCVGTDSLASNSSLSILDELRQVRRIAPDLQPDTLLSMGTLCGARALGRGAELGSLAPGKRADLVALSGGATAQTGAREEERQSPAAAAVEALFDQATAIVGVWIEGLRVLG